MLLPRTVCSTCSWRGATVHHSLLLLPQTEPHYICLSSSSSSSPTLAFVFSVDAKQRNVDAIYSTFPIRLLWLVHRLRRYLLWTKLTFRSRNTWSALEEQHFGRHSTPNASQYWQQQKRRQTNRMDKQFRKVIGTVLILCCCFCCTALYEIRDHLCSHQALNSPQRCWCWLVCSQSLSQPVSQSLGDLSVSIPGLAFNEIPYWQS